MCSNEEKKKKFYARLIKQFNSIISFLFSECDISPVGEVQFSRYISIKNISISFPLLSP